MMDGGIPEVVAEWHGHIDHDKGAWKAVQMATFYADEEDAMVVIESNTLETEGTEGNNFEYILDEIAGYYSISIVAPRPTKSDKAPQQNGDFTPTHQPSLWLSPIKQKQYGILYTSKDARKP